jgi:flagellar basal body-associated protein FliL
MKMSLLQKSLFISLCFTLLVGGGFFFWKNQTTKAKETLSADEIVERTIETKEITTNLFTENFAKAKFSIQLNSSKAKEEAEKVLPIVESKIIKILSQSNKDDLKGNEGIQQLETKIKDEINTILPNGKAEKVYATELLIQ